MQTRWIRLRNGAWGVRVTGAAVDNGDSVTVTKKNGTSANVVIGRVLWTDGDVSICSISREGESRAERNPKVGWTSPLSRAPVDEHDMLEF